MTINLEVLKKLITLFDGFIDGIDKVTEQIQKAADELSCEENDKEIPEKNIIVEKTEFVTLDDIRDIVQAHKPAACDGIVIAKKFTKEDVMLFLTFVKGRTLLDNSINAYIIIKAEAMSKELKKIFGDNNVIILK